MNAAARAAANCTSSAFSALISGAIAGNATAPIPSHAKEMFLSGASFFTASPAKTFARVTSDSGVPSMYRFITTPTNLSQSPL